MLYYYVIYKVLCCRDLEFEMFATVGTSNEQVSGRKRKATDTTTNQAKRARVNECKCWYDDRDSYTRSVYAYELYINFVDVLNLFFSRSFDADCHSTQSISS